MQSITSTSHASTRGTTKRFMSMSSQSIIDSGNRKSLIERCQANGFLLAVNMDRLKVGTAAANFGSMFHLLQCFCVFMMPSCDTFWKLSSEGEVFQRVLEVPLHFCVTESIIFHLVLAVAFAAFWIAAFLWTIATMMRDADVRSCSNTRITWLRVVLEIITPSLAMSTFSLFGVFLNKVVFKGGIGDIYVVLGLIVGLVAVIMAVLMIILSFLLVRVGSKIQYDRMFAPWGANVVKSMIMECVICAVAMIEEALPMDNVYVRLMYGLMLMVCVANPVMAVLVLKTPLFQNPGDSAYYASMLIIGFTSTVLILIGTATEGTSPSLMIVIIIVMYVIVSAVFERLKMKAETKLMKRLYDVYRKSKSVLPHITPLVFAAPLSNQVAMSQESYQVMQAFNSLEIKTPEEFRKMLTVGAKARMPAISNIDFIKWGLNYFYDDDTLLTCGQICHHFGEHSQTQSVLLQKLGGNKELGLFARLVLTGLEHDHTDAISDKPLHLLALHKKASNGITRCKRGLAVFWGSVLNHSEGGMSDAMCAVRSSVAEAEEHFDELMRCYPMSTEAISLYLSYLTEIRSDFMECNHYISEMSTKFVELKAEQLDEDESPDAMSVLLADEKRPFAPYVKSLGSCMEQQRHLTAPMNKPLRVLLGLTLVSLIVVLGCLVYSIINTLIELQKFPKLVKIVSSFSDVVSDFAQLIIAERRLCLFATKTISKDCSLPDSCGPDDPLSSPETTMEYILERAEVIGEQLRSIYTASTFKDSILRSFLKIQGEINYFDVPMTVTLTNGVELIALQLRQIAGNFPKLFEDSMYDMSTSASARIMDDGVTGNNSLLNNTRVKVSSEDIDYSEYDSICSSREMRNCIENILPLVDFSNKFVWVFYDEAYKQVMSLDELLYWSMIVFPVFVITIFGIAVIIVASYIHRESQLRMTLYLSLPEQVASEIFRAGGGSVNKKKSKAKEVDTFTTNMLRVNEEVKEKAMAVETLYQVVGDSSINGTGLSLYVFWMIVYILIAAVTVFGVSLHARSVNATFISRIMIESYTYLRTGMYQFVTALVQELFFFHGDTIDMGANKINGGVGYAGYIWMVAGGLFANAQHIHESLTFGSYNISMDFREYQTVEDMYLRSAKVGYPDVTAPTEVSAIGLVHDGYSDLGFHASFEVYNRVVKYILAIFATDLASLKTGATTKDFHFKVDDANWKQFSHLSLFHLYRDLESIDILYTNGGNAVISEAFIISCLISASSLIVALFILIGPMYKAYKAIRGYVTMQILVMGQVPPKVFHRSMYIQKWLKGEVTRGNFRSKAIEPFYRRMVSKNLQDKLLLESPEKLILFTAQGSFTSAGTIVPSDVSDPSLEQVLGYLFDVSLNKGVFDGIQQALERFGETKDARDNAVFHVNSLSDTPLKLTMTGIVSDSSVSSSVQRFYSHVAILVRDITKEAHDESQYATQKERTLGLMSQMIPGAFARRLHDGERSISFTSGIGSVLTVHMTHYETMMAKLEHKEVIATIMDLRAALGESMKTFQNISKVSFKGGTAVFVAGLFNEEQNGRTEAIDTLTFIGYLHRSLQEVFEKRGISSELRYGVATGGPIFCHVMMESTPLLMVSGDVVSVSHGMLQKCAPQTILLERTTYECIYGLNIEAQMAGEMDHGGKKVSYYSVPVAQVMRLSGNNEVPA